MDIRNDPFEVALKLVGESDDYEQLIEDRYKVDYETWAKIVDDVTQFGHKFVGPLSHRTFIGLMDHDNGFALHSKEVRDD